MSKSGTMTVEQYKQAVQMALRGEGSWDNLEQFDGFGLPDYQPRLVSLLDVAGLFKWQCCRFDGGFDWDAANEVYEAGRRKFLVVE